MCDNTAVSSIRKTVCPARTHWSGSLNRTQKRPCTQTHLQAAGQTELSSTEPTCSGSQAPRTPRRPSSAGRSCILLPQGGMRRVYADNLTLVGFRAQTKDPSPSIPGLWATRHFLEPDPTL